MPVRAKFKLHRTESTLTVVQRKDGNGDGVVDEKNRPVYDHVELKTLVMGPIYPGNDPSHENKKFWEASPSGELKLGTINPEAWSQFELGKSYYIDITEAPD